MIRTITILAALVFIGGTASAAPAKIESGKQVSLAYKLTVKGEVLETADKTNPFTYVHGQNQIVPGLEKELAGLVVGDKKTILVLPEEGYGVVNPKAFVEVDKAKLPPGMIPEKGGFLEARDPRGVPQLVKIAEVKETTVVVDFNHPLAGKELEFQIEVLSIK